MEPVNRILKHTIGIGDAFVLAQMFKPGLYEKRLDHSPFFGNILEHAPGIGAIAATLMRELFKRGEEWFAILWLDVIFDRD